VSPRPFLAVAAGAAALAFARVAALEAGEEPVALLRSALYLQGFWILLALAGALLAEGASVRQRLGLVPAAMSRPRIALAVAGFLAVSHGVHLALVSVDLRDTGSLAQLDSAVRGAEGALLVLAVAAVGIVPGVAEELLFRGLVQGTLQRILPALAAVGASAALFGVAHADPVHSSGAFVLGLYLGAVAWRARSVWPAIACHVTNNAAAVLLAALRPPALPLSSVASAALLFLAGAAALALSGRRAPPTPTTPEGRGASHTGIKGSSEIAD
jgi:membrane protease YdiL (CAAX protease family)